MNKTKLVTTDLFRGATGSNTNKEVVMNHWPMAAMPKLNIWQRLWKALGLPCR